ncbi:MAG TPA: Kiwa anti-phage protein KwaB-like domain-containing protein [Burkholderiales bacterium]|nr:Kiwa anti-phage protein KwaB-like domain-containing protein [Burkholderiales bacterium]
MKLQFDLQSIKHVEFGVGRDIDDARTYAYVPVDAGVQQALREMVDATWAAMRQLTADPPLYEPSEKHASEEYLHLPLDDELSAPLKSLHEAVNLDPAANALQDPGKVFCYFARLTDAKGRKLTALRRATQFKGVLKNRLIRFADDTLRIIEDRVFKLDTDFDVLIDDAAIHILRPSGFEFAGQLQSAILAAVPKNAKALQHDIAFVDFGGIAAYAATHPRAARYLASIRGQKESKNIDKRNLKKLCKATGVDFSEINGKLVVDEGHVMGFLEVLDRRRYEVELVKDQPEHYRAASRAPLQKKPGGKP